MGQPIITYTDDTDLTIKRKEGNTLTFYIAGSDFIPTTLGISHIPIILKAAALAKTEKRSLSYVGQFEPRVGRQQVINVTAQKVPHLIETLTKLKAEVDAELKPKVAPKPKATAKGTTAQ